MFSRYLFAFLIRIPGASSIEKALLSLFTLHAYVGQQIVTDEDSVFPPKQLTELMQPSGIKMAHATPKHIGMIGMTEVFQQKLNQIVEVNAPSNAPHWHRYVNLAVMAHNPAYHQTLK